MKNNFTILIADRNPHIRKFLRRELARDGLTVITADSLRAVLHHAFESTALNLLVLDPDLPDMDTDRLMKKINARIPPLPLVWHPLPGTGYPRDTAQPPVVIEKGGGSVDEIKTVIRDLQRTHYQNGGKS